ncbi:MAG TPA: glycosyltransferase family 39 protein [Patescibacteria group bacterium]|nr:glycosyltransferase family 39 protein [Patescibacteria group bacterium]
MKLFLKKNFKLLAILLVAFFLRFVGISWGLPYHFHPDEWNMANAVSQLSWADKLQPHFFAYGQLPLYLSFFSGRLYNLIPWINLDQVSPTEATFFLRFWSALAGVGTVSLVYLITKRLLTTNYCLLATLLAAFTPGLIQIAHFGTTESLLSFFFLATVYFSIKIVEENRSRNYFFAGLLLGLALGTKISALVFAFPIIFALLLKLRQAMIKKSSWCRGGGLFFLFLCATAIFFFVSSPYVILNFSETKRILLYEAQVASGQIPVFYTRQFLKTTPVLFQLEKIFPYALGWPIFILGMAGFLLILFLIAKKLLKTKHFSFTLTTYYLLLTTFLVYFFSQAFLFCKWTRFMAPIFAFFPIFATFFLSYLSNLRIKAFLVGIALLPGIVFSSIYFRPDIRFQASDWIYKNIPASSRILSETGNVIDIPILPLSNPDHSLSSVSFDFYRLDENPRLLSQLLDSLSNSDYVFVPSRRLFANHLRLPQDYPLTAKYYKLLFSGQLGFTEIKKFQPFPNLSLITYHLSLSDESAEETWSVFDHPVVRVFQKKVSLTRQQYEELFKED